MHFCIKDGGNIKSVGPSYKTVHYFQIFDSYEAITLFKLQPVHNLLFL